MSSIRLRISIVTNHRLFDFLSRLNESEQKVMCLSALALMSAVDDGAARAAQVNVGEVGTSTGGPLRLRLYVRPDHPAYVKLLDMDEGGRAGLVLDALALMAEAIKRLDVPACLTEGRNQGSTSVSARLARDTESVRVEPDAKATPEASTIVTDSSAVVPTPSRSIVPVTQDGVCTADRPTPPPTSSSMGSARRPSFRRHVYAAVAAATGTGEGA